MRIFSVLTLSMVAVATLSGAMTMTADAQTAGNETINDPRQTATPEPGQTVPRSANESVRDYVTDGVRVLNATYRNGEAVLVIESDSPQAIMVSDAGAISEGSGNIPSRSYAIDGKQTVSIPATETSDGRVGVVVSVDGALYGIVLEPERESPFEKTRPRDGWIGGSVVALSMTGLAAYRVKNRKPTEPERMQ